MELYSTEPKTRKYVKRYGFLSLAKNISKKNGKQLLDTARKTGLDALKTVTIKVELKEAETTGKFIGKKIADKILKPKPVLDENLRDVEEIIILLEKQGEIFCQLRQIL